MLGCPEALFDSARVLYNCIYFYLILRSCWHSDSKPEYLVTPQTKTMLSRMWFDRQGKY